jgi:putative nucleotidyltransferase with HDIG domain
MTSRCSSAGETLARVAVFFIGSALLGAVTLYLGFDKVEAAVILALGGLLCALAAELPWGGFLFPGDAVILALCLLTGRNEVALAGVGTAIASSSLVSGWKRSAVITSARTAAAALVAVALWRGFIPSGVIVVEGITSQTVRLAGSNLNEWVLTAKAIPALLLCATAYLIVASVIETLFRSQREYAFGEFWLLNCGRNLHHLVFTAVLGATISVAYRDIGPAAFVLFAFPIILTRDALKRSLDLRASRMEALKALSSSVDARDTYTYNHSSRVSHLATMLAREMGFTESTVEMIEGGALLHDIGKLSVDAEILSKPGPLEPEERVAIREHPLHSAEVVSRVELLKETADIVKHHHERPDGTGYPAGLKGHEIPVGARILNVADAFDAMISDRPYRRAKTVEQALDELRRGSGSEFDPVVVEYMTRLLGKRRHEILSLSSG